MANLVLHGPGAGWPLFFASLACFGWADRLARSADQADSATVWFALGWLAIGLHVTIDQVASFVQLGAPSPLIEQVGVRVRILAVLLGVAAVASAPAFFRLVWIRSKRRTLARCWLWAAVGVTVIDSVVATILIIRLLKPLADAWAAAYGG